MKHGRSAASSIDRGIVEQRPLHRDAESGRELGGDLGGRRVGREVVEPVHEQHRVVTRVRLPARRAGETIRCARRIGVDARGTEVAVGQVPGDDAAAVRRHPPPDGTECVDLVTVATPVDERSQTEAGEQLRELRRVPEGVGHIGDTGARPERRRDAPTDQQVPDVRFARREQRVGLDVPRPDRDTTFADDRRELSATIRAQRQVVVEHDRLPVEHEAVAGIGRAQLEHPIDRADEPRTELLERPVPLAVPVDVGHQHAAHGISAPVERSGTS